MTKEAAGGPSSEPPTDPVADLRKTTQRSELDVTQKRAAFSDARSPESILLAEVRQEIRNQMGVVSASIQTVRTEMNDDIRGLHRLIQTNTATQLAAHEATRRHVARMTTMTVELWKSVFGDKPPPPPPSDSDEAMSFALSESDPNIVAAAATAKRTGSGQRPAIRAQLEKHEGAIGPMRQRLDSQEGTLASLHGQMLVMDGRQERTENDVAEVKREVAEVKTGVAHVKGDVDELLRLQREQMGKKEPPSEKRGFLRAVGDAILYSVKEREGQKFALALLAGLTSLLTAAGTIYALATGRLPMPTTSSPFDRPIVVEPAPSPPPALTPHFDTPTGR